jgi:hypothetical protein
MVVVVKGRMEYSKCSKIQSCSNAGAGCGCRCSLQVQQGRDATGRGRCRTSLMRLVTVAEVELANNGQDGPEGS